MDLNARMEAVLRRMAQENVGVLITAANGLHTLDLQEPAVHLSGYLSWGESLFVLYRDGAAKLFVSPASDGERLASFRSSCPSVATDDIAGALAGEFKQRTHASGCVATAGFDSLPYALAERLFAISGPSSRSFDVSLDAVTGSKTAVEIERARRATSIAEMGLQRMIETARPGMRECDLAVTLNLYTKSLGADDNFLMLNASQHNPAVMPSSARKLEAGDILLTEFSPSVEGQFSQICRTCIIGPPSAELKQKYDLVVRAMWAGIEIIRPGIPISHVCRAIDQVLESAGYGEYCKPPHMRRRGHGLGSGSIFPGDVATGNDTLLEQDMVFVVHPNQYLPETGYLMCGEPIRVTATGVETLSERTAFLGLIPGGPSGAPPCA